MSRSALTCDVVVVGSGAAGAVVAARMAEGGARTVVLEEGRRLGADGTGGDVRTALRLGYRNSGAVVALGRPPVLVQVGCCVGGSTVINGGTCFRTPPEVLASWSALLQGAFQPDELATYFDAVERDLGVAEVPPELAFEGERRLLEAARARGDVAGYVRRNAIACQGTGLCAFGCPTGAKQSMERSYLPRAERHGAQVLPRVRVERILLEGDRAVGVRGRLLDPPGGVLEVRAEAVVVCAGALHTPVLLRQSLGARAPAATGLNLHLHPGAHVVGLFDTPVLPRRGPMQSVYVAGPGGHYVIFGMGMPPEVLAPILLTGGGDLTRLTAFERSVTVAVMVTDHGGGGRVRPLTRREPLIRYELSPADALHAASGILHAAELLFAIGASEVHHGIRHLPRFKHPREVEAMRGRPVPPSSLLLGSVHPMGTCRMGVDPRTSVVDPDHRVHGVRGLYVPDASFFPSSLGVNPQMTISAFALRCAERLLARGSG